MTVNQNATRAGKKFETDLMKYMREREFDVERLRLTGVEDEGDLMVRIGPVTRYVIEAKRTKSLDLAGWVREAQVERENYDAHRAIGHGGTGFVVVHYARNKGLGGSYVTTTLDEWLARL